MLSADTCRLDSR